jgi:hypothetical protein
MTLVPNALVLGSLFSKKKKSLFIVAGVFFNLFDVLGAELFCSIVVVAVGFSTRFWVSVHRWQGSHVANFDQ